MNRAHRRWMNVPVKHYPYKHIDQRGQISYGRERTIYVYPSTNEVLFARDAQAQSIEYNLVLFAPPETRVNEKDKFILPDGRIFTKCMVNYVYDQKGRINHLEVLV